MKYYIVESLQNKRGIWVSEDDLKDTIKFDFAGHKGVRYYEISKERYYQLIHGEVQI
jgi:hypothetical protein